MYAHELDHFSKGQKGGEKLTSPVSHSVLSPDPIPGPPQDNTLSLQPSTRLSLFFSFPLPFSPSDPYARCGDEIATLYQNAGDESNELPLFPNFDEEGEGEVIADVGMDDAEESENDETGPLREG